MRQREREKLEQPFIHSRGCVSNRQRRDGAPGAQFMPGASTHFIHILTFGMGSLLRFSDMFMAFLRSIIL